MEAWKRWSQERTSCVPPSYFLSESTSGSVGIIQSRTEITRPRWQAQATETNIETKSQPSKHKIYQNTIRVVNKILREKRDDNRS